MSEREPPTPPPTHDDTTHPPKPGPDTEPSAASQAGAHTAETSGATIPSVDPTAETSAETSGATIPSVDPTAETSGATEPASAAIAAPITQPVIVRKDAGDVDSGATTAPDGSVQAPAQSTRADEVDTDPAEGTRPVPLPTPGQVADAVDQTRTLEDQERPATLVPPTQAQIANAVETTRTVEDTARPRNIPVPKYLASRDARGSSSGPGFTDVPIPDPTEHEAQKPRRWPVAPIVALTVIMVALIAAAWLRG